MLIAAETKESSTHRRQWQWLCFTWAIVFGFTTWFEFQRLLAALESELGIVSWFMYWDLETTLPFFALLTFPLAVLPRHGHRNAVAAPSELNLQQMIGRGLSLALLSITCSWWVGASPVSVTDQWETVELRFCDLPPAYHDEYSYLLQARTFAAGRLSWPPMTVRPDLFHQMHVLNEHRTISRYFPWTGLWMAPFEAAGRVLWGHWLAGGLATLFFYLSLVQVIQPRAAILGGLLIATSPGIAVFSNLLLAHHPTLLALSIFLCAFFRMMRTDRLRWAWIAGTGLTLAMLGRPMTAAGFAFPFGVWMLFHMIQRRKLRLTIGFVVPLLVGLTVLAVFNIEATGSMTRSAYQEYTDTYTPSHRYGFNNAVETPGDHSRVLAAYDTWAKNANLTPKTALENLWNRCFSSLQWSLALFPLLFGLLMALPRLWDRTPTTPDHSICQRWGPRLLVLSVISLHIAHIPYWFVGIMHWHYVFETAPLLLALASLGLTSAYEILGGRCGRKLATCCVAALIFAGLVPAWISADTVGITSKVSAAVGELSFSRLRLEAFGRMTNSQAIQHPALIMVDERSSDPQLSYVINDPQLKSAVIICRRPDSEREIDLLRVAFPDRTPYEFDPVAMRLKPVPLH